jgi:hypothetical protein
MKKIAVLSLALLLASPAFADKDPFEGWTPQQLKVKVLQLQKENRDLKEKLSMAPVASTAITSAPAAAPAKADLVLDNFEADMAGNGMTWWTGCDDNKLGTSLAPQPWAAEKGGSPVTPGRSGRIKGHMGTNQAPWPWASMALALSSEDLRGYSAVSFYAKGDGGKHKVSLGKREVKDFAYPVAEFSAPKAWTKVSIKLSDFAQPSWGAPITPLAYQDVEKIQFMPGTNDADYDFQIDDLTLVK